MLELFVPSAAAFVCIGRSAKGDCFILHLVYLLSRIIHRYYILGHNYCQTRILQANVANVGRVDR